MSEFVITVDCEPWVCASTMVYGHSHTNAPPVSTA